MDKRVLYEQVDESSLLATCAPFRYSRRYESPLELDVQEVNVYSEPTSRVKQSSAYFCCAESVSDSEPVDHGKEALSEADSSGQTAFMTKMSNDPALVSEMPLPNDAVPSK